MNKLLFLFFILISFQAGAQKESDSTYARCPIAILDTATGNNYFIAHQPAIVKSYRNHGDFVVVVEQKGQYFTMMFHARTLRSKKKYRITMDNNGRGELSAKYSFRSGESVAFIDVSSGTVEVTYDKNTKLWKLAVNGLIANMGDTRVSYFKAKGDIYIK